MKKKMTRGVAAIILNISIREERLIEGRLLFEEIR